MDFACAICLSDFVEPVTAPCCHTLCRRCYSGWVRARAGPTATCPTCVAPLAPEPPAINIIIRDLLAERSRAPAAAAAPTASPSPPLPPASSAASPAPTPLCTKMCAACAKPANSVCARCHSVVYCDQDCQRADFPAHKAVCRAIEKSRAAAVNAEAAASSAADLAAIQRGVCICTGCTKVINALDAPEHCDACKVMYCSGWCRVAHQPTHVEKCVSDSVARLHSGMGRLGGMEGTLEAHFAMLRRTKGYDHEETLTAMSDLGTLLERQGKLREAEALRRELLERRLRVCGEDHPNTLVALGNLAGLLSAQGRYSEALPLSLRALEGTRRVWGPEHEQTIISANNHAVLFFRMGKFRDAQALSRATLTIARSELGNDHCHTLSSLGCLASSLKELGRLSECEPLMLEHLETSRRMLGSDHPNTLLAMGNFAMLLHGRRRFSEAEPLLREVLATKRRVHPQHHPEVLVSLHNLGFLLKEMRRWDEAEALLVEALAGRRATLEEGHPHTRDTAAGLEELRQLRGGRGARRR